MSNFSSGQVFVLVIEEKHEVLEQVTAALAVANYSTCCCSSLETALTAAEATPPDLIISATSFNGQSGMELCERIKQHPGREHVPVMFLSGGQIPDIIRRQDHLGGTYYIRKPFDPNVLLELVDKALQLPAVVS